MLQRSNFRKCLRPLHLSFLAGDLVEFRCGKCANCLAHRGNELTVRVFREAIATDQCHWVTLTYDDEHCPICQTDSLVNTVTGEVVSMSDPVVVSGKNELFFSQAPFEWRRNKKGRHVKRYFPLHLQPEFLSPYRVLALCRSLYFSVDMSGFQLLVKRHRHKWPDTVRYIAVPEYGGCGYRPHIHVVFCGITEKQLEPFIADWKSSFGKEVDFQTVRLDSSDRNSDIGKISSYVSKYACKGKFDCPFIGEYCLRPRRASSVHFGAGSDQMWKDLKSYLLAYDVYGEYDPWTAPDYLSAQLLLNRRVYAIGDFPYPLPHIFIDWLFRKRIRVPAGAVFRDGLPKYLHKCYKVLRFDRKTLEGYVPSLIPRLEYSGQVELVDGETTSILSAYEKTSRYFTLSSALQQKISLAVLSRLREDAEAELQAAYARFENDRASLLFYIDEFNRVSYNCPVENAFRSKIEDSVF